MHFGTPLSLLTMVMWLSSLADAGRSNTSGTAASSCTASCPPKDSTGVALGTGFGDQSTSGGILSCSYPKPGHADPSATYCEYNTSTGALRQNDDYGDCHNTAPLNNCPNSSKRGEASERHDVGTRPQAAADRISRRNPKASKGKATSRKARQDKPLDPADEEMV